MTQAEIWYFSTNYDLLGTKIPASFVKVSVLGAVSRILTSRATVLEVPEPLWMRQLPRTMAVLTAWRITGLLRGASRRGRTYAIENNEPGSVIFGAARVPYAIRHASVWLLGAIIRVLYERIAFGSEGARTSYTGIPFVAAIPHRLVAELPARNAAARVNDVANPRAIFVGRLEGRKGLEELLRAWPVVEAQIPAAVLTLVGSGPLEARARSWASERPHSRNFLGQLPHSDLAALWNDHGVLIAPSRRQGRWREQIGLPIEEALSFGLTVVTTSETGLAKWLSERNHEVISENFSDKELTDSIVAALRRPRPRAEVLLALPELDGRISADEWIHHD